jgi:hypothetical protein
MQLVHGKSIDVGKRQRGEVLDKFFSEVIRYRYWHCLRLPHCRGYHGDQVFRVFDNFSLLISKEYGHCVQVSLFLLRDVPFSAKFFPLIQTSVSCVALALTGFIPATNG